MEDKRGLFAVITVAIILLLLLARWKGPTEYVNNEGDTYNLGGGDTYTVPSLNSPYDGSLWDWMQTTDLMCGCDAGLWKAPDLIAPVINVPINRVYVNIVQPQYTTMPDIVFNTYQAPPLPTWWQTYLRDTSGVVRTIRVSSTGEYFRIDQNQTYAQSTHRPSEYTLSGVDLYYGTRHYVHDAMKDLPALPSPKSTSKAMLNNVARNNGWTDSHSDDNYSTPIVYSSRA